VETLINDIPELDASISASSSGDGVGADSVGSPVEGWDSLSMNRRLHGAVDARCEWPGREQAFLKFSSA
jgi:hypothetical protein